MDGPGRRSLLGKSTSTAFNRLDPISRLCISGPVVVEVDSVYGSRLVSSSGLYSAVATPPS